tara:strand:- start:458 stop:775 length:318 start_codon:yes stop_codon:yes gene_type:complete
LASDEFEHQWAEWMAIEGLDLEDQIQAEIKDSAHRLDMRDGTHGQWDGNDLGVLIVFDENEVRNLLRSWEEAQSGNMMSIFGLMNWLEGIAAFLGDCIKLRDLES